MRARIVVRHCSLLNPRNRLESGDVRPRAGQSRGAKGRASQRGRQAGENGSGAGTLAVLAAFETTLEQGLDAERKNFFLLFSTEDMHEGMKAFIEKRKADFQGR